MREKAYEVKIKNIIDMAVSFSAMGRVFEKGSAEEIKRELGKRIDDILSSETEEEYREKHGGFCKWFTENIRTAARTKNGEVIKDSKLASWGQAAKVIDIALKVCIYYCGLPSAETSKKITHWLNGAIDTKILEHLKGKNPPLILSQIHTIEGINKIEYEELQKMIRAEIEKLSNEEICPVQYDDIKWRELNR